MIAIESFLNAVIGFVISWAVTWHFMGFTPVQSIGWTAVFFALSFTRAYVIRSIFRRIE